MSGDKNNPDTLMDGTWFDGTLLERGWNSVANTASDKGSSLFSKAKSKATDFGMGLIGFKDVDGDGKRDFDFMSLLGNLGKGGVGLLAFGLMNKMLGMGFFQSALISVGVVLAMNYLPKLMDSFNEAAPGDNPKSSIVNKKTIENDPNVISNKTTGVPTTLKIQPELAME